MSQKNQLIWWIPPSHLEALSTRYTQQLGGLSIFINHVNHGLRMVEVNHSVLLFWPTNATSFGLTKDWCQLRPRDVGCCRCQLPGPGWTAANHLPSTLSVHGLCPPFFRFHPVQKYPVLLHLSALNILDPSFNRLKSHSSRQNPQVEWFKWGFRWLL